MFPGVPGRNRVIDRWTKAWDGCLLWGHRSYMEPRSAPSERTLIQSAIEDLITRLNSSEKTADLRALLIEAQRLRSITATWWAVPPPPAARIEMLARISQLSGHAAQSVPLRSTPPS